MCVFKYVEGWQCPECGAFEPIGNLTPSGIYPDQFQCTNCNLNGKRVSGLEISLYC